MSGLPSVMLAKKAKLVEVATLPPMEAVKKPVPVIVHRASAPTPAPAPAAPEPELDLSQFAVSDDDGAAAPDAAPTPTPTPSASPSPAAAPAEGDDPNEWKWKYKSLEGNHQLMVKENRDMRDKLVELELKFESLKTKPAEPVQNNKELEFSETELAEYGNSLPFLTKLLKKQQAEMEASQTNVVKSLQDKINELQKTNEGVTKQIASSDESSFVQQVKVHVKDFDAITKTPDWLEFTNRPVSAYTDQTIGQALWSAHGSRDLSKVLKVFEDFTKSKTVDPGAAYRAPSVSSAAGALPNSDKKPTLKWSEREKVSKQFRKGQISHKEYERVSQLYKEADAEGRIDYNR